MSAFGVIKSLFDTLLIMMKDLGVKTNVQKSILFKDFMNIAVRCT